MFEQVNGGRQISVRDLFYQALDQHIGEGKRYQPEKVGQMIEAEFPGVLQIGLQGEVKDAAMAVMTMHVCPEVRKTFNDLMFLASVSSFDRMV